MTLSVLHVCVGEWVDTTVAAKRRQLRQLLFTYTYIYLQVRQRYTRGGTPEDESVYMCVDYTQLHNSLRAGWLWVCYSLCYSAWSTRRAGGCGEKLCIGELNKEWHHFVAHQDTPQTTLTFMRCEAFWSSLLAISLSLWQSSSLRTPAELWVVLSCTEAHLWQARRTTAYSTYVLLPDH